MNRVVLVRRFAIVSLARTMNERRNEFNEVIGQ